VGLEEDYKQNTRWLGSVFTIGLLAIILFVSWKALSRKATDSSPNVPRSALPNAPGRSIGS